MHDFSRPLAEAVKKARCKMKLTQEQVGELADTNARTISAIENGQSNTRMNILYVRLPLSLFSVSMTDAP